jgi:hypothetical protein
MKLQAVEVWTILMCGNNVSAMPTVLRIGPYRFFFYAGDRDEPQHVHIERDNQVAKFWLAPVRLHRTGGLGTSDINRIWNLVEDNREMLARSWNEYFGA